MSLLSIIFDDRTGTVVVAVAAYVFAAQYFLRISRERRNKRQEALHNAISRGLLNGALETVEDFVNVYKGVHGLSADDITYRAGLGRNLREYLVRLVSDDKMEAKDVRLLKEKINVILKQIEAEAPFADLPAAERNLIIDVQKFVGSGDVHSANQKLQDLAGLVEVRQDALERLQASNKWSIPLAIIGLVLTVIFGIVSLK